MENIISIFSSMNTENDQLPPDLAKDLVQIISSIKSNIESRNSSTVEELDILRKHIADHNNPHHLKSVTDLLNSLISTIYLYYSVFYNRDAGIDNYSIGSLSYLLNTDPLIVAELLRRIQLNCMNTVDGYKTVNDSHKLLTGYYTNDIDINVNCNHGVPVYSVSNILCSREYPYIAGLSSYNGEDKLDLANLKDYYFCQDTPSYGLPFGNKNMLTKDMLYFAWDERYIGDKDNANGIWSLMITPHNIAILVRPSYDDGCYRMIVKIGDVDNDSFSIDCSGYQTYTYLSDRPLCAITFSNDILGYISLLKDGVLTVNPIPQQFKYVGRYDRGKCFSSVIVDSDILPISVIDPNHTGVYTNGFMPSSDLIGKMTTLELCDKTVPMGGTGYIPDVRYLAERVSHP